MVESLEEFKKNQRKSKSLEENKHYLPIANIANDLILASHASASVLSEMGPLKMQNKWSKRFSSLTEYDKKRHDGVKAFVEALRRLEERGIIKHCGIIFTFI
jgi:hypothetical protein